MLFSFKKLKELSNAPTSWTSSDMVTALNKLGFEVEGVTPFVDAERVKYAKVLSITKNPNGDKLNVCEMQFDDGKRIIQTSDDTILGNEGKVVTAFIPGSRLRELTFADREMKGIVSQGMLCAIDELIHPDLSELIPDDWKGVFQVYDSNTDITQDPLEDLGLYDDIIELDILSNRSDANSYFIIAQELKAYLKQGDFSLPELKNSIFDTEIEVLKGEAEILSIAEAKVEGLKSSFADKIFLMKSGIKPQYPVVDLTNLTLLMTGQPVHAYDKDKIGSKLTASIKTSKEILLGQKEIEFEESLLIVDNKQAISAAGVMGFANSAISKDTTSVILEIGKFNIKQVRKTAKQTKLNSLASRQSSKNLTIGTQELAWAFISNKMQISNIKGMPQIKNSVVKFDKNKFMQIIGTKMDEQDFKNIIDKFEILGFKYSDEAITVPKYRHDISSQQDINEELLRLYGYDNLKPEAPKIRPFVVKPIKHNHKQVAAMGYQEVYTYSLISKKRNIVNPFNFKESIELETFVSKERETIRNSMAISLLEVIKYNQKRKSDDISIFSLGQINNGISVLGLASTTKTFAEVKQDVINIISKDITFERSDAKELHSGVSAMIKHNDKVIGWIGKVHPSIDSTNAFVAEIKVDRIDNAISIKEYSEEQMKTRDITFELSEREEIGPKLNQLSNIDGIFQIKIIDKFLKDKINKVTIRVFGSSKAIKQIDNN